MAPKNTKEYFYLHDGRVLKDIKDLLEAFQSMDHNVFAHHARSRRDNDFSKWIKDVFHEHLLASSLSFCKSKENAAKILFRHLYT